MILTRKTFLVGILATCAVGFAFAAATTEESTEGPMSIVWRAHTVNIFPDDDGDLILYLNDRFDVDIQLVNRNVADKDAENLAFAAGDIPDTFHTIVVGAFNLFDQGIIRPISTDLMEDNMRDTYRFIEEYYPEGFVERTFDGDLYGIPYGGFNWQSGFIRGIRQDWLDNLGLETPKTLAELESVLRAFTYDDPDGNGIDDTYGANGEPGNASYAGFADIFGAFGVMPRPSYWMIEGSELVKPEIMDGYKDGLEVLARWYKDGLINPEMPTEPWDAFISTFADGRYGSYTLYWRWLSPAQSDSPAAILMDNDPSADFVVMDGVTGPQGERGTWAYGMPGWSHVFGRHVSDEKVARVMQILDAMSTDLELHKRIMHGVEGVDYELAANGQAMQLIDNEATLRKGIKIFQQMAFRSEHVDLLMGTSGIDRDMFETGLAEPLIPFLKEQKYMFSDDSLVKRSDVNTLINEFFWGTLTGNIDIDDGWDAYVESLMDAGLEDMTAEINQYNM